MILETTEIDSCRRHKGYWEYLPDEKIKGPTGIEETDAEDIKRKNVIRFGHE